ncbi:MAG TPA: zinc-binding dehydrogenase [Planctomycetota bacterium]|nr:zinc-binding dehydrogenase [Planctomycetota bacterium]
MKAICIREFGGNEKVQLENLPEPKPGPGQALIRVKAAALNHLDIWVRKGRPGLTLGGPHILGSDAAGVLEALGPGSDECALKPGAEVIVNPGVSCMKCEFCLRGQQSECPHFRLIGFQNEGVYAERAVVPAVNLFPKPAQMTWEEAAALPLSHITAFRMLFERAKLLPGETVLIHGIGGGVALAALQMIAAYGASAIVTSSSAEKLALAKAVGGHALIGGILYRDADVAAKVKELTQNRGVDLAFDTAGAPTLPISMAALRRGGRMVTCGVTGGAKAEVNLQQLYWNHLSLLGSTMGSMEDMRRMLKMVASAEIKPVICQKFPLESAKDALALMEEGKQCGKIVLQVGG